MAFNPVADLRRALPALLALLLSTPAFAQNKMPLADTGIRKGPDYAPAHLGEQVRVSGVVSAPAFHFPAYRLLAIQDESAGAVLQSAGNDARLDNFLPGDVIQADGVVQNLAGMPVILTSAVQKTGTAPAPSPVAVSVRDLNRYPGALKYLGRLVRVQSDVIETAPTAAGGQILVGSSAETYKYFIPTAARQPDLSGIRPGDVASATGVALQYCPVPPHNRFFELLVSNRAQISMSPRSGAFNPLGLALALSVVLFISFFLWSRERRLKSQRERLRKTYQLAEDILGSSTPSVMLERLADALPAILGITRVRLYVHNRAAASLETVPSAGEEPVAIPLGSSEAGSQAGAVACFHYRTLLVIPDTARSPFPISRGVNGKMPKSMLLVPMLAQGEVMGVMELDQDNRARDFKPEEQAIAQHLGNQIGVAIRLFDQRSVQEQLFRTEKMAAVGRLVSGVANELKSPLASIRELAENAMVKEHSGPAARELSAILSQSRSAAEIVERLITFGSDGAAEARPVSIPALLRRLIRFREGDWKASGIKVNDLTSPDDAFVLGSEGQLEQVFLNLLVHAEQCLAQAARKLVTVRTVTLAGRALVEIGFTAPIETAKMEAAASVLGLARGVVAGHGGEARLIAKDGQDPRFEVELPAAPKERAPMRAPAAAIRDLSRPVTALVIEPDDAAQKQLVALLAARSCRVVPVGNADSALELSHRMRFDAAFCSVHAPGLNWVELSERMQARVAAFVLLSDGYDAELSADFEGEGRFVLPKPVQETELERVLRSVAAHASV